MSYFLLVFSCAAYLAGGVRGQTDLQWSSCGGGSDASLDCATLKVPLEYADPTYQPGAVAEIPLARYKATVASSQRKGSLLTNPGGPGASGRSFVLNGAGKAISTITGGFYDIIGWDTRGVASAQPILQCYATAGEEYAVAEAFPVAAEVSFSQFRNASYLPEFDTAVEQFDSAVAKLAKACADYKSPALFTSSAAYVARDMVAIVNALDGTNSSLNYWGFSYGTIFGAEFIQTYPNRVGRMIFDGVVDASANAEGYDKLFPIAQLSVRDTINDFVAFCERAGPQGCALATPPPKVTADLATRLNNLQASLYRSPVVVSKGLSITIGIFTSFMSSFIRTPTTWTLVAEVVSALETGNATPMASVMAATSPSSPKNPNDPAKGLFAAGPLQCIDNAPMSDITLTDVRSLLLDTSLSEDTPWANTNDLTPISFCRNFPDTRPRVQNMGSSKLPETNTILAKQKTLVLIINSEHDPNTPLSAAQRLHQTLSDSSQLVIRRGPGHTTVSLASLGLLEAIRTYFNNGALPGNNVYDLSQEVFSPNIKAGTATPAPIFNGTYNADELSLLQASYDIILAFITLA
ncbi:hypothetical protein V8E54_005480 [Elaphomyces granulatus]